MKAAVIGSRGLTVTDLGKYLPEGTTEIVSGGAKGIDTCAKEYVLANNIKLTGAAEFFIPPLREKTYCKIRLNVI